MGSPTSKFKDVWRAKVPLKIKIFMWQAIHGKLHAADQIHKCNGRGSDLRALCAAKEDTNPILFNCDPNILFWSCIRSWLDVNWSPSYFGDLWLLSSQLSGQKRCLFWFGFSAMCWVLYGPLEISLLLIIFFLTNMMIVCLNYYLCFGSGSY